MRYDKSLVDLLSAARVIIAWLCHYSRGRFDSIRRRRSSGGEYSLKYSPKIKYLHDLTTPGWEVRFCYKDPAGTSSFPWTRAGLHCLQECLCVCVYLSVCNRLTRCGIRKKKYKPVPLLILMIINLLLPSVAELYIVPAVATIP